MFCFAILLFGIRTVKNVQRCATMHPSKMKQIAVCVNWLMESGCEILRGIREFTLSRPNWDVRHVFFFQAPIVPSLRPHGVISSVSNKELRAAFSRISGPIVGLSYLPERADVWIRTDQVAIGRQAAEHLLTRGFRHFGYLSVARHPESAGREKGFRQAVSAWDGTISACHYDPLRTVAVNRWLRSLKKPAGVFCFNDYTARDLLTSCQICGLRVPEEIAIVGADNETLWCEMSQPQLTSVALPWRRFGYEAAAALDRLLAGGAKPKNRVISVAPIGVVTRQSTDSLAIGDPKLARVLAHVRAHACEGQTLSSLLRNQFVDARWLRRKCRQHLGRGPHEEILRVQMERAKSLLSHTALQIKEIAGQVGLSRAHFADTFTKVVGTTPSAYRQANRL